METKKDQGDFREIKRPLRRIMIAYLIKVEIRIRRRGYFEGIKSRDNREAEINTLRGNYTP